MNIACHHRHVCTVQKHTPLRQFGSSAAVSSSLRDPPWSGTWAAWRACHEPAHLVLGEVLLRTAQGPSVPDTLGGAGTSVGYYGEPGVLRDHGGSVCLCPFGTGYPACYQWSGVGPMWWHWVTWCGCPAVPGDAVGVFLLVAPRLPW